MIQPEDFTHSVARTVERYCMDLSRPLALVSGGPDSVALLRVLVELGALVSVLHFDHGLRGEESREDADFVRRLCSQLGVPFEMRRLRLEEGAGLQERAREERYRVSGRRMVEEGHSCVAVGHNADDVAETVVMNLARGAGLRGLSGIPPLRGGFVRPLIERDRGEIISYLDWLGQPYRMDPTNVTGKYARNRVRREILPVLEELYPEAGKNISRAAGLLREDLEILERIAGRAVLRRGREVIIELPGLRRLLPALRRHAIRLAYAGMVEYPPLDSASVERVLELVGVEGKTRLLDLPGGVRVAARPEELAFYHPTVPTQLKIPLCPGEEFFEGWKVVVSETVGYDRADAAREEVAYLSASSGPYSVRHVREGDVVRPLGLGGSKRILKALKDRGVPRDLREKTPVVVDGEGRVAWVFCGELGEEFAVAGEEPSLRVEVRKDTGKPAILPDVAEVLIPQKDIQQKVGELGARITADYRDKNPLLVGILRGAVIFMSDLMRTIDLPCEIDFMDISSYGAGTTSSGVVRILKDLEEDITGRHVLIVEDIVDTGLTLSYLRRALLARHPASLEICAILSKPARRTVELPVKYLGFEIPDRFVVGYGLDYAGAYRNLPDIRALDGEEENTGGA